MIKVFRKLSAFMNEHGKLMEILAMVFTLMFIAYQTLQMNFNISEIKKSVVLEAHQAVHGHRQRMNRILLEVAPDIAEDIFNLDKEKLVAYTMSSDYESLFYMRCSGLISEPVWKDIETMMQKMLKNDFMNEFLDDNNNTAVGLRFARYIKGLKNNVPQPPGDLDILCANKTLGK
ncbi:hypothetical protein SG34_011765 [Thalassomonas viridans]|uniref:Uncharacterized protein n=1 Tax=Thalassomonas viridans TaxID=137584 RepID=A0AAE9Z7E0_9GAMM|nr:hypothetical protein [Thalassomonas viridans]WDE07494.1 hypothetical protein SG34_011765 [Thalassomonas viridans]